MNDDVPDIHTLSGAYALDALEPGERAAFERHLESCEQCRDEVRSFEEALAVVVDASEQEPPDRLRAGVLGAIANVRPLPPVTDSEDDAVVVAFAPRRRRGLTTVLAVAAAVLGVALAGTAWRTVTLQIEVTRMSAAAVDVSAVLTAPDAQLATATATTGGRGTMVMSPSSGRVALITDDLPPVPAGMTYQIWYVGKDAVVPAGFLGDGAMSATVLAGHPDSAVAVGVTVEPSGGSAQPTSDPFLTIALPTTAA
jgi:anti-sigma-K factor RskA